MAYKYPNFAAEMARTQTDYSLVYSEIASDFDKSADTISNWITGKAGNLPTTVAFAIRNKYFPTLSIDYLFSETPLYASEFKVDQL